MKTPRAFIAQLVLIVGTTLVGSICSLAAGSPGKSSGSDLRSELAQKKSTTPSPGAAVSLEGPIDPATYILGPGDRLAFTVWGAFEYREEVSVDPDGKVAVPTVGEIAVAGKSLAAAAELTKREASRVYPKSETELRLIAVRKFKAAISGAVEFPGVYEVSAVDRVSALALAAGGFLLPDEKTREEETIRELSINPRSPTERRMLQHIREAKATRAQASLRRIRIVSRDGSARLVDLLRFYTTGDLAYNPVLMDGDAVEAPLVDRETGVLNIFGAVKKPGEYEFLEGDRLRDLVELAGGFRDEALREEIAIVRFDTDGRRTVEVEGNLADPNSAGVSLQADDRIFVRARPDYRRKYMVAIKGEVKFPGDYPITRDGVRLSEVIKASGGLTDRANLSSARVIRRAVESEEDPEFERLKTVPVSEMTDMEYEYFKIRSREESPPVVVDFVKLLVEGDESQDIILADRDEIEIPTLSPTVKVAGQVNSPGLIRFIEGRDFEYYIGKAGGYSWNARKGKIRLIKAHSGMWIKPKKETPIEIGDTIFVPEKQETDWWELSKDMLQAVSQIATVLIMIRSLK